MTHVCEEIALSAACTFSSGNGASSLVDHSGQFFHMPQLHISQRAFGGQRKCQLSDFNRVKWLAEYQELIGSSQTTHNLPP